MHIYSPWLHMTYARVLNKASRTLLSESAQIFSASTLQNGAV